MLDSRGKPLAGVRIVLQPEVSVAVSDAKGAFEVAPEWRASCHQLRIASGQGLVTLGWPLDAEDKQPLLIAAESVVLQGRVTVPRGAESANLSLSLSIGIEDLWHFALPLEGTRLSWQFPVQWEEQGRYTLLAPRIPGDDAGRFLLGSVPKQHGTLSFSARGFVETTRRIEELADPSAALEVVLERARYLRFEWAGDGRPPEEIRVLAKGCEQLLRLTLRGPASHVLTVPVESRFLAAFRDGEEIGRARLSLLAGQVSLVRLR